MRWQTARAPAQCEGSAADTVRLADELQPIAMNYPTRSAAYLLALFNQLADGGHRDRRPGDASVDMGRTAVNVFGNTVSVKLVQRLCQVELVDSGLTMRFGFSASFVRGIEAVPQ